MRMSVCILLSCIEAAGPSGNLVETTLAETETRPKVILEAVSAP